MADMPAIRAIGSFGPNPSGIKEGAFPAPTNEFPAPPATQGIWSNVPELLRELTPASAESDRRLKNSLPNSLPAGNKGRSAFGDRALPDRLARGDLDAEAREAHIVVIGRGQQADRGNAEVFQDLR